MRIELAANKEPYHFTQRILPLDLLFVASDVPNGDSNFVLRFDNTTLTINSKTFFELAQAVKGQSQREIVMILEKFSIDQSFADSFLRRNNIEVDLFKSLFLIYYWVEIAFVDAYAVDLTTKIYNEFIVDFNNRVGSQQEIYFINKSLITTENAPHIERLWQLNLLIEANFSGPAVEEYKTYFVPLEKPGVHRTFFAHASDRTGDLTYSLWKTILEDRDSRLTSWSKNRY